jgi:hypothetical protein
LQKALPSYKEEDNKEGDSASNYKGSNSSKLGDSKTDDRMLMSRNNRNPTYAFSPVANMKLDDAKKDLRLKRLDNEASGGATSSSSIRMGRLYQHEFYFVHCLRANFRSDFEGQEEVKNH